MLSELFIYTWAGAALIASGLALPWLYNRCWTRLTCAAMALVGLVTLTGNHTFAVIDLITAIIVSAIVMMAELVVLVFAWRLSLINPDEA